MKKMISRRDFLNVAGISAAALVWLPAAAPAPALLLPLPLLQLPPVLPLPLPARLSP